VITHPVTGEKILYISQGFTQSLTGVEGLDNTASQALLQQLLAVSGQLDAEFKHELIELLPIEQGDIILWDNRRFVHHAKHSGISEPSKTFRLTVYDEFEFSA
jgi:taurine dioxygenase